MINFIKKLFNIIVLFISGKLVLNLIPKPKQEEEKKDEETSPEDPKEVETIPKEEENMSESSGPFILNTSEGKPNYSQRKSKYVHIQKGQYGENKIDWSCLCNSHALIMAFLYAGWVCPQSSYDREPDAFAEFVVNECLKENNWFKKTMYNLWLNWYEGQKDAYTPLELHDVLAHYACEWFKSSNADHFYSNATIKDVFNQLYTNRVAVPTSIQWAGLAGHVITLVGFKAPNEQSVKNWLFEETDCPITSVLIDDPWGCIHVDEGKDGKYYGSESGNDVEIPYSFFMKHWKPVDNNSRKFAHFIGKPVSVV